MPNPGYPAPRGVRLILQGGMVLKADVRYRDVVLDAGVPTPRFELVLPHDLSIEHYTINSMEADYWPPGTIICFPQRGDAQSSAERIVAKSRYNAIKRLMMRRTEQ